MDILQPLRVALRAGATGLIDDVLKRTLNAPIAWKRAAAAAAPFDACGTQRLVAPSSAIPGREPDDRHRSFQKGSQNFTVSNEKRASTNMEGSANTKTSNSSRYGDFIRSGSALSIGHFAAPPWRCHRFLFFSMDVGGMGEQNLNNK